MKVFIKALVSGGQNVWVEDHGNGDVTPVPGSITDTWKRVLQITTNKQHCAFFLRFDEVNIMAGSEILKPGIKEYPLPTT